MADNSISDLTLKVGVEIDDSDLQQAKKQLLDLQTSAAKVGAAISGRGGSGISSSGSGGFLNSIHTTINSNVGTLAGSAIGGIGGFIAGGPLGAAGGAAFGSKIGTIIEDLFHKVDDTMSSVASAFSQRLSEDMHLRQLSFQTGMTREELYKLQTQAKLAGTSLETIVDSGQNLSDELIGGFSTQKAQLLQGLGINPVDLLQRAKGDPAAAQQEIFKAAMDRLKFAPAAYRTSVLKLLGFSPEEADARRRLNNPLFVKEGQRVLNLATNNGATPFLSSQQLNEQIVNFVGKQQELDAQIRNLLTTGGAAAAVAKQQLDVQSEIYNLLNKALTGATAPSNVATKLPDTSLSNKAYNILSSAVDTAVSIYHSFSGSNNSATSKAVGSQ